MNKIFNFKKIVFVGFLTAFLAVFLSAGTAQASFWDWFNLNKANNSSQQAAAIGNHDLTVTVSSGGTVTTADGKVNCSSANSPCKYSYGKNDAITFKLIPNNGYVLSRTGGCSSDKKKNSDGSYTCKVKMTSNRKLSVDFNASGTTTGSSSSINSSLDSQTYEENYKLKLSITGGNAVVKGYDKDNNQVISCRGSSDGATKTCSAKVQRKTEGGNKITLKIDNYSNLKFGSWGGDCTKIGANDTECAVSMGKDRNVTLTMNKDTSGVSYNLNVRKTGSGTGKVTSVYMAGRNSNNPDGKINCGNDCSEAISIMDRNPDVCPNDDAYCSPAYLKAEADSGSEFVGWNGCQTYQLGSSDTVEKNKAYCYISLEKKDKTVTATFNAVKKGRVTLNVTKPADNTGVIKSTDGYIRCGWDKGKNYDKCSYSYPENKNVRLKAIAETGYAVTNWKDACGNTSSNSDCNVKMEGEKTVSAVFEKKNDVFTLTIKNTSGVYLYVYFYKKISDESESIYKYNLGQYDVTQNGISYSSVTNCLLNDKEQCEIKLKQGEFFAASVNYNDSLWDGCDKSLGTNVYGKKYGCTVTMSSKDRNIEIKTVGSFINSSSAGSSSSQATTNTSSVTPKNVKIEKDAKNITSTSATLKGSFYYSGGDYQYNFACRKENDSYESGAKYSGTIVFASHGNSGTWEDEKVVSGLSPSTSYKCRLAVMNSATKKWFYSDKDSNTEASFTTPSSSASVDLKVAEVWDDNLGTFSSFGDSVTLVTKPNSSVWLKWTVSEVKDCSLGYSTAARKLQGTLSADDIINESGKNPSDSNTTNKRDGKHRTDDYQPSGSDDTVTYTLSCKSKADDSSISDTVTVNY